MQLGTGLLGRTYKFINNILFRTTGQVLAPKKGRLTEFRKDDTIIVSYPKSGSSWLMFLVANLMDSNKPTDLFNVHKRVPDLQSFDSRSFGNYSPRVLRSHEFFDPNYPKVICIVRDPRSIAVSFYYHSLKRYQIPAEMSFDEFFELFLDGGQSVHRSWDTHV